MAKPLAPMVPCTDRKSVARGCRQETCWMLIEPPMVLTVSMATTSTKTGSNAQNDEPNVRSNPGQPRAGSPNQGAAATRAVS